MRRVCLVSLLLMVGCDKEVDYSGDWERSALEMTFDYYGYALSPCTQVTESLNLNEDGTFTQVENQEPTESELPECEGVWVETAEKHHSGLWTAMALDDDGTTWISFEADHLVWIREEGGDSVDTPVDISWAAEAAIGVRDERRVLFLEEMGQYVEVL